MTSDQQPPATNGHYFWVLRAGGRCTKVWLYHFKEKLPEKCLLVKLKLKPDERWASCSWSSARTWRSPTRRREPTAHCVLSCKLEVVPPGEKKCCMKKTLGYKRYLRKRLNPEETKVSKKIFLQSNFSCKAYK